MTQENTEPTDRQEMILLVVMGIGALSFIAFHVSPLWGLSHLIWFGGFMALLAFLAFINASLLSGYRNAAVFLALGAIIGFTMEKIGVETGLVFGQYVYSDKLGTKLSGVPYVIPLCWFGVVYFAHVLTNLIINGHPAARKATAIDTAGLALITALIATGFDVAVDPVMSHKNVETWIWTDGGEFFGVPFRNFQGWLVTSFLIDVIYRTFTARAGSRPVTQKPGLAVLCAICAWAGLAVGFMLISQPVESQMIAVFTILVPAIIAAIAYHLKRTETRN